MFEDFWTFKTDLPAGSGTPNFSPIHLCWLAGSFLLIVVIIQIYKKQNEQVRQTMQRTIIIAAAILEVSRWIWAALIGHYSVVEMLPLHLCSLSIWMEMAAVFSGKSFLKNFGYALCLPGAIAAVLTPDWSVYPFISFQYLHSVVVHTLLMLVPAIWIWGDGFRPDYRKLPICLLLLILFALPVYFINIFLGSNYLFLHEAPKGTPLEIYQTWFGNPGYLFPLFITIMVVWLVFYLPWMIKGRKLQPVMNRSGQS